MFSTTIKRRSFLAGVAGVSVAAVACSTDSDSAGPSASASETASPLPDSINAVLTKPRYTESGATWSLLVSDVETGEVLYALNPDDIALTGSTRKLFSVGMALNTLGADHRINTPVHRTGSVEQGTLNGDLILVGNGDLTFGGRRIDADTVQFTDFDHNDANNLGTAIPTPQDPLFAINDLAAQVKAAGITTISGNVIVDDRLFTPYRVPNGNLLITPILVNENMVDVIVDPTQPGQPATVDYRPKSSALTVAGAVTTVPAGTDSTVTLSDNGRIECVGVAGCTGTVGGDIAVDYQAPLTGNETFVGTFRIEDPAAYARTAFIEALRRNGITMTAQAIGPNPADRLPAASTYTDGNRVAAFVSPPYLQQAQLILKVSLNLGANLALSLFGLTKGATTIDTALAAERETLIADFGLDGNQFDFPTNGSGSPDSKASPRALVQLLTAMSKTDVAADYQACLPVMGVNGSLASTGTTLPGKGHVFAKTGTTVEPTEDGEAVNLVAQNLAGYIETKSGRTVAYALMVNNAGRLDDFGPEISSVFEDEGVISSIIYETL
ncbi:D-alanyl-D-alanine carboxypeptidase/D-alanyl-D-alanine-endopeptidase [Williamsia sp. 1138]|uniref:D-alanyl-D-alanine carboxypeptidase/D-alanyl-D-alanine endopeptidase n=1 Tax=Williamsia sp. 1138 TaxID=1903117 RepID=UPI000A23D5EA|nr:D-alanyl-D-alanine carboxypeptidase/D-alanyl-D-alanine-endopeptidase [Williamsia sp. 1138]